MASQYGPLEIDCDAPPYAVVEACSRIGFRSPLDTRWCRASQAIPPEARHGMFSLHSWKQFFGGRAPERNLCHCGQSLPVLEKCTFTFLSGRTADYLIGQCCRCRTIYWEEA
jgi:hypothetical protein